MSHYTAQIPNIDVKYVYEKLIEINTPKFKE